MNETKLFAIAILVTIICIGSFMFFGPIIASTADDGKESTSSCYNEGERMIDGSVDCCDGLKAVPMFQGDIIDSAVESDRKICVKIGL